MSYRSAGTQHDHPPRPWLVALAGAAHAGLPASILCNQTTGLWGSPGSNPLRLPLVVVWHALQSLWRGRM
jgi:hypothetical protein